jgi:hypothetical protein
VRFWLLVFVLVVLTGCSTSNVGGSIDSTLVNQATRECLSMKSTVCDNSSAQHWTGVNRHFFRNREGLCLVASEPKRVAAAVCDFDSSYQKWASYPDGTLRSLATGFCLAPGPSQALCDGLPAQHWEYLLEYTPLPA